MHGKLIYRTLAALGLILSVLSFMLVIPALSKADGPISDWKPDQTSGSGYTVEATKSVGPDRQSPTISGSAASACPDGMIAYWKLDETTTGSYDDFFNGHDGACPAGKSCPAPATGQINGGQVFTTGTGIDVPAHSAFDWNADGSFSIELWMQGVDGETCPSGSQVMVGRHDSASNLQWWLGCKSGLARFKIADRSGSEVILENAGPSITDGNWHHLVGLRDGTNNLNRLYIDGAEVISATKTYTDTFIAPAAKVSLGWVNFMSYFHLTQGTLDEVAIYNKALSATEIQQHYLRERDNLDLCETPSVTIAKTPDTQVVVSSSSVTFNLTITNTSSVTLTNLAVSDSQTPACARPINNLAQGASFSYMCSTDNVTAAFTNTAVVSGNAFFSGIVASSSDTAKVDLANPAITIDKIPDNQTVISGTTAAFTVTMTNTGNITLTKIFVTDPVVPDCARSVGTIDDLTESASYSYPCSIDNVTADITSTATVTGSATLSDGLVVSDFDTVTVIVSPDYRIYLPIIVKNLN